jgi:hypothetical protein
MIKVLIRLIALFMVGGGGMKKTVLVVAVLVAAIVALAQTREETTIQVASADVAKMTSAVQVKYLNLPWGAQTFSYIENGTDEYYSKRDWPFAHLISKVALKVGDVRLEPGDYVLVLTPGGQGKKMQVSIASFKPDASGTFLRPGNIFVPVPSDAKTVYKTEAAFTKDQKVVDHMKVEALSIGGQVKLNISYGDRRLVLPFVVVK